MHSCKKASQHAAQLHRPGRGEEMNTCHHSELPICQVCINRETGLKVATSFHYSCVQYFYHKSQITTNRRRRQNNNRVCQRCPAGVGQTGYLFAFCPVREGPGRIRGGGGGWPEVTWADSQIGLRKVGRVQNLLILFLIEFRLSSWVRSNLTSLSAEASKEAVMVFVLIFFSGMNMQ